MLRILKGRRNPTQPSEYLERSKEVHLERAAMRASIRVAGLYRPYATVLVGQGARGWLPEGSAGGPASLSSGEFRPLRSSRPRGPGRRVTSKEIERE